MQTIEKKKKIFKNFALTFVLKIYTFFFLDEATTIVQSQKLFSFHRCWTYFT